MAYVTSHQGLQDREQLENSMAGTFLSTQRVHSRINCRDEYTNNLGAFFNESESNWGANTYSNNNQSTNTSQYYDVAKWACDQTNPTLDSSVENKHNIDLQDLHYAQWIHELYCANVWPGDNNNMMTQFGITSAQNIASPLSALELTNMTPNSNPNSQDPTQQNPNSSIRPNSASYTALQSLIANGFSNDGSYAINSQELGQKLAGTIETGNKDGNCSNINGEAPETSSGSTEPAESATSPLAATHLMVNDQKKCRSVTVCAGTRKRTREATSCSPPSSAAENVVHVRAKRGRATDSHSLAERVRRERISQRMRLLQELVPSCDKVLGKAAVLEEIINYVKSLQRQIEFLSMKLAASNPSNILIRQAKPFSTDEEEYVVLNGSSFWSDGHTP